jgi:trigger factor
MAKFALLSNQISLDTIVKAESIQVNEIELTEHLIRMSQRYGMGPEQFAQELQKRGGSIK